jgi:type IV secretory pathway protease TraF
MARWKKPYRAMSRWLRLQKVIPDRGAGPNVPKWMQIMSSDAFLGLFLSLVPGLAHMAQGRFREIRWYFLVWIVLICSSLYLYGSSYGMFFLGLAIAVHTWIAIHHMVIEEIESFGSRLLCALAYIIVLLFIYLTVQRLAFSGFITGYTNMSVPYHNIEQGDLLLARRLRNPETGVKRGSMVLVNLDTVTSGRNRFWLSSFGNRMIVEIIGLPGEMVWIRDGNFFIDGQQLDSEKYPVPGWLRDRKISVKINEDGYFVSSAYSIQGPGRNIPETMIHSACIVQSTDIEAKAFMRWLPLSRRGFLMEVE